MTVTETIVAKVPLDKLKIYLQWGYKELRPQLAATKSVKEVMHIIEDKFNITNIYCLEMIAERFVIKEFEDCITAYKKELSHFCEIKISQYLNKNFGLISSPELAYVLIKFILDWKSDSCTFNDIRDLLHKAYKEMANDINVKVITEDNYITVTCYAPRHIMDALLTEAEKNLHLLRGIRLIKLTIGYHTIWNEHTRDMVRTNIICMYVCMYICSKLDISIEILFN